ncbi:MAG: bleomycin resistance family protein [Candidatus Latescibacteria bacterium]|nr:bleomycin resistance family protein [Candidatus Latescibacterota bacterium]
MAIKKLTPNLMVEDVRASVEFYVGVLRFTLNMVVPENSKTIENRLENGKKYVYAMVSRDEVYIMLMNKDVFEEDLPMLNSTAIGASVSFYIEVDDINAIYNEINEKAEVVKELETTWYGMQEFYIKDCNGYILGFAQRGGNTE